MCASFIAARIASARSTSFAGGVKISLASATWLGWIAHLPSQPRIAVRLACTRKPSGSPIIAERPVDRHKPCARAAWHHAEQRIVPQIVPVPLALALLVLVGEHHVIGIAAADIGGAHALRRRVIGRAEMQALQALRGAGDLVDIRRGPSTVSMMTSRPIFFLRPTAARCLRDQHVDGIDVRSRCRPSGS